MPLQFAVDKGSSSATGNPFESAETFANDVKTEVFEQIDKMNGVIGGDGLNILSTAQSAIEALQDIGTNLDLPPFDVTALTPEPQINLEFTVSPIGDPGVFGVIDPFDVTNTVDTSGIPTITAPSIPDFTPTPLSVNIPAAPAPGSFTSPGPAPANPGFTYPDAVVVTLPDSPDLINIQIPAAPSITLPDFDPAYPAFAEQSINTQIDWTEPTYVQEAIDEVLAQISVFFAGGSGIDPDVEESIFARGRDRQDRLVSQQEMQATEEWANRGYTAPPGMLVKRLDNIREEGTLQKLELNREQTIKVHQDEIDNLRFAVQQGIQAEDLFIRLYLAKVGRLFDVQRLNVEWQIQLYELLIRAYQAQLEEVRIRAQVYETQVRAALFEIEVFKALIEGERVKSEVNRNKIEAYKAEIESRQALVDIYEAQVRAVGVQAQVFSTEVDAYRSTVQAYAAEVAADKNRFDAYVAQVQGESAKVGIIEAEARAYQAEVGGIETGVRAEAAAIQAAVSGIEAEIRNFEAQVRGSVSKAQTQLAAIQANVAGHEIDVRRKNLEIDAERSADQVELAAIDATNRTHNFQYQAAIAEYTARLEEAVKGVELLLTGEQAAGQLAATIGAGAMAALNVGATISGSGGTNAQGSDSVSFSFGDTTSCDTSTSVSYSVDTENPPDLTC